MSGRAEAVRDRAGGEAGEFGRGGGEDAERVAGGGVDGREAAEAGVDGGRQGGRVAERGDAADSEASGVAYRVRVGPLGAALEAEDAGQRLGVAAAVARHQRHDGPAADEEEERLDDWAALDPEARCAAL